MKFTLINCEQRSPEWHDARLGRLTGSRAAAMKAQVKSGEAAGRKNLRMDMSLERITHKSQDRPFMTGPVQRGIDKEPHALNLYEAITGDVVERLGFLSGGGIMAGCSLDGAIGRVGLTIRGILETKCPNSATHYGYLKSKRIPTDYYWQCIHNLWVSGAEWCDFVSFDDRFPEDLQYLCVRLERNEKAIKSYETDVMRFLAEVSLEVKEINKMRLAA